MKPPGKRAAKKAQMEQERKEALRGILEIWKQRDQEDRRKVVDLKTAVQLKARHKL